MYIYTCAKHGQMPQKEGECVLCKAEKITMKLSNRIREIVSVDGRGFDSYTETLSFSEWRKILAAVEAMEEGRVLPRLPDECVWCHLEHNYNAGTYHIGFKDLTTRRRGVGRFGIGPTPAAAAEDAIRKIDTTR